MEKPSALHLMLDPTAPLAAAKRLALSLPVRKQMTKREAEYEENDIPDRIWSAPGKRIL